MKKSTYMDRAMKSKDPRFARVLGKLGYERRDVVAEAPTVAPADGEDALTELRAEYQSVVGKRAYHGWDEEALREKIAQAQAGKEA